MRFFLGLEVARCNKGTSVSQRPFTMQLLQDTSHLGSKPASTLMEPNLKLSGKSGTLTTSFTSCIQSCQLPLNLPRQGLFYHTATPDPLNLHAFTDAV
uniref:Uncharacterized protein n=1 Tax=Cannabis sativa TaxID=3483 RepID=A0A803P0P5_CANSA